MSKKKPEKETTFDRIKKSIVEAHELRNQNKDPWQAMKKMEKKQNARKS